MSTDLAGVVSIRITLVRVFLELSVVKPWRQVCHWRDDLGLRISDLGLRILDFRLQINVRRNSETSRRKDSFLEPYATAD